MRLTKLNKLSGEYTINENASYEDVMRKLYEYEEAEEQGSLIKVPCKVSSTVYYIHNKEIIRDSVKQIDLRFWQQFIICQNGARFNFAAFDRGEIFLTKAEALQALKERE